MVLLTKRSLQTPGTAARYDDIPSFVGQNACDRLPHPAGCTGYQCHFIHNNSPPEEEIQ